MNFLLLLKKKEKKKHSFLFSVYPFQEAISCLASISDSSAPKEILSAFVQRFNFLNNESDSQALKSDNTDASLDDKQENMTPLENDVKR